MRFRTLTSTPALLPPAVNRVYNIFLWILIVSGFSGNLYSQQQEIRFERLSLEQGLSQGSVYSILQDRKGFMWFGTEDGLNRYDGHSFEIKRNDPEEPGSLSDNTVFAIHEDRSGTLWVGTWAGGVDRYDRENDTFRHYRHNPEDPNSLSHNRVRSIYEDRAAMLWIGTEFAGLNRYDKEKDSFESYQHDPEDPNSLSHNTVWAILEDQSGVLWIGTYGGGVNRFDRARQNFVRYQHDPGDPTSLSSNFVTALYEDSDGVLWVGTEKGGLNKYDHEDSQFIQYRYSPRASDSLGSDFVHAIFEDRSGALWVGTREGGLCRFDRENENFKRYQHDPIDLKSLSYDVVLSIYEDRSGVIWVGTEGGGLSKFNREGEKFAHYRNHPTNPNSLSDNMVYDIVGDQFGSLWVGTWEGGLNRFDQELRTVTSFRHDPGNPESLSSDSVYAIYEDRSGVLWIGTRGGGLDRYDRYRSAFVNYRHEPNNSNSLTDDIIISLLEDQSRELWIGTNDGGLNKLDRTRQYFSSYRHDPEDRDSLSSSIVWVIYEDRSGTLWFGTETGGLNEYDRERDKFVRHMHDPDDPDSLSNNSIQSIYEDRSASFWVGTYGGGLNKLDRETGTFISYRVRDGLPNDVVYGILEDDHGFLWMSTNKGLSRFDAATEEFINYDATDGLQSDEFNFASHYRSGDGEMFFGGINGFSAFHPDRIKVNPHVPPIVVTAFRAINPASVPRTAISEVEEFELSYKEYFFSFEVAALDYRAPEKNRYAYKLEGFNDEWVALGTKRDITFTNLDPGPYTLRVKGSNNDGVWNEEGLRVGLTISPPYWQTWWFRAGGVFVSLFAIVAASRIRTRTMMTRNKKLQDMNTELNEQIEERKRAERELEGKNAELERFAYTVSHDLKSPLVTIKGFLGYLERDAKAGDALRMDDDLARINQAAEKMSRLLEELLELSRIGRVLNAPQDVDMDGLAREAVDLSAGRLAKARVRVEIEPGLPVAVGDRVRLLEVLQNLLENASRFMGDQPEPCVTIGARGEGEKRVFYVQDNGIGIDAAYHEKIFGLFERLDPEDEGTGIGLALVKRIVAFHGGRVWVESEGLGKGSTFYFTLSLHG